PSSRESNRLAVTESDIGKIADPARLSLPDDDVPAMTAQRNRILAHMGVIAGVDTTLDRDVEAVAGASTAMPADAKSAGAPLRGDAVAPFPMNTTAPMLAPESEDGFILVPRLSTHEEM